MKPLLSLVGIFKNEAKSIREVLEAAKPHIDRWTLLDTGSTDGTQDIIREVLADVPGQLFEEPFAGYAASKNRVMELDRYAINDVPKDITTLAAEFQLMLGGDEFLRDGEKLREYLETQRSTNLDCIFVRLALDNGLSAQARVLRTGSAWHYDDFKCNVDEVPVHTDPNADKKLSTGGTIEHIVADPIARMDNIWENHIPMLHKALEADPVNARALELLIQKYEAFFPHMEEEERIRTVDIVRDLYRRRFELPFEFPEQQRYLLMRHIDTERLGNAFSKIELLRMAHALCESDKTRPEPFMLRAVIAATCDGILTSKVYELSREAAEIAEKVRVQGGLTNSSPLDTTSEWKAHRLAALAAANLAKKHPENLDLVRNHIAAGIAAGGPWEYFKGIIDDGAIEAKIQIPAPEEKMDYQI